MLNWTYRKDGFRHLPEYTSTDAVFDNEGCPVHNFFISKLAKNQWELWGWKPNEPIIGMHHIGQYVQIPADTKSGYFPTLTIAKAVAEELNNNAYLVHVLPKVQVESSVLDEAYKRICAVFKAVWHEICEGFKKMAKRIPTIND